ncbi:374_t:CDS:10 [Diversispora eburnea]|uniref:374_t:CDS:1 n=1 Tax=Diversispora eburnea TaxID=1213867 RepID=A0A9N9G0V7_9GLOM|nr:374_t:CDS:10 [Diversispora eburnea]
MITATFPLGDDNVVDSEETNILINTFENVQKPDAELRTQIATQLNMSSRAIQVWFQNRRAKVKRDALESKNAVKINKPKKLTLSTDYYREKKSTKSQRIQSFTNISLNSSRKEIPIVPNNTQDSRSSMGSISLFPLFPSSPPPPSSTIKFKNLSIRAPSSSLESTPPYLRERRLVIPPYDDSLEENPENPFAREEIIFQAMSESDISSSNLTPKSPGFIWRNLTGNENGPFLETIVGVDREENKDISTDNKGDGSKTEIFTMDDLKKLIALEVSNLYKETIGTSSIGPTPEHLRTMISHEVKKEISSQRADAPRLRGKYTAEEIMEIIRKEARKIVSDELLVFSQDKLNVPDFALHSGGAKVISRYTSKTYEVWPDKWYHRFFAQISGQGVLKGKPPVTAISPDTNVGHCWPFFGTRGQLAILLNRRVHVTAVTYDHVSKHVAVEVESAPKEFEVWGIIEGGKEECGIREDGQYEEIVSEGELRLGLSPFHLFLGRFTYNINGKPVQTFEIPPEILKKNKPVRVIIMKVLNNWGRPSYTCLYRFRVHGEPVDKSEI